MKIFQSRYPLLFTLIDTSHRGLTAPLPCLTRQRGSAIIWILIMVALFAALSFVISRGFRTGETQLSNERAKLAVTEILTYTNQIQTAVKQLQIGGTPLTNISFEMPAMLQNGTVITAQYNANCTIDSCKVFKPSGGGLNPVHFWQYGQTDQYWDPTWARVGGVEFYLLNVKNLGTTAPEIVMKVNGVHPSICFAMNEYMGLSKQVPADSSGGKAFYFANGANYSATDATDVGYVYPDLAGKKAFCNFAASRTINVVLVVQ